MTAPIPFRWMGDGFTPMPGHAKRCDDAFVVGKVYTLVEQEDRSSASHRHFFAQVRDIWGTLPEHLTERFPSDEHLRSFALIKAGFADCRTVVCSSRAEAIRMAAFVRGLPEAEYAIITAEGATVTVWTAKSQSMRAMDRATFQASKDGVFRVLAELIGTDPTTLAAQSGQAA